MDGEFVQYSEKTLVKYRCQKISDSKKLLYRLEPELINHVVLVFSKLTNKMSYFLSKSLSKILTVKSYISGRLGERIKECNNLSR